MKLRIGQEIPVKKGIFWQFRALGLLSKINFDCVQMSFYVEFLDTCYEDIRKSEAPKMVIFGRKPKPIGYLHFSTDFKNFNGTSTYEACATSVKN